MFKKIIITIFSFLLIPLNTLSCPHIDSQGVQHLQIYNSDYTEANMIYPKQNYLYMKRVTVSIEDSIYTSLNENEILKEIISVPIHLNLSSYITYYSLIDNTITHDDYLNPSEENVIEPVDYISTSSDNYSLKLNLTNTYQDGLLLKNQYTKEIYYDVSIDDLSEDQEYLNKIKNTNLTKLSNSIINIKTDYQTTEVTETTYETDYHNITELKDSIELTLTTTNNTDNVVAVNLNEEISLENMITTNKVEENKYTFTITKPGTYVLVDQPTEIIVNEEISNEIAMNDEQVVKSINDISTTNNYYYLISIPVILLVVAIVIKLKKSR